MNSFAALLVAPFAGILALRMLRDCRPLGPDDTTWHGLLLFLLGYLAFFAGLWSLQPLFLPDVDVTQVYADLPNALALQAVATAAAALVVVGMARTLPLGAEGHAGLRRHPGPSPLLVAACAWLAWLPVMALMSWVNIELIDAIGLEIEASQAIVRSMVDNPENLRSPLVWLSACVIVPVGEEIWFRGALQGGLRVAMPPSVAAAIAALMFAWMHDGASMLPVATLGFLLGMLYERSGSLVLPMLVHCLHNTAQLVLLSLFPESVT